MLASCSSENIPEEKAAEGNVISFRTVVSSRAASLYGGDNGYDFTQFKLYARATSQDATIGADYFLDETFEKDANENLWRIVGQPRFWLDSGLDFYAHVNGDSPVDENGQKAKVSTLEKKDGVFVAGEYDCPGFIWKTDGLPTIQYVVPSDPAKQQDLLVAYNGAVSRPVGSATSNLNFRHALSQVVFQAKNTNDQIRVEIFEVALVNVAAQGTFTYPQATASVNSNGKKDGSFNAGLWTNRGITSKFTVATPGEQANFTNVAYNADADGKITPVSLTNSKAGALMMIPQAIAEQPVKTDGACLLVKLKVYNVGPNSDVCIYGSEDANGKDVLVPLGAVNWQPGNKYCYTLSFGSNAGYDPNQPDDPALKDIRFSVSVDDFEWTDGEIFLNNANFTE